ncbi:CBS domain-containing protein [Kitasatospora purpeofusca]|uniref:CBS domain-containing protein n=1 Tax=Kitasatospora purpeofusca TaxID=67352 RepID=UPI00225B5571|nr:CBS domain-containing protein [Kitasatospora purpeofusca]MCX4755733.1 CBS domain-containing protein [Kitasatospora purpeofusca]WSR36405.1 CBS domain-containing protein [Kitasatospora purpeofusca]WSR44690.1 CBS domain-containing protein [Kitasatospora purpeofusca]
MTRTPDTVADVMTRAVVAVGRDADFREVAETLRRWQVSAVPVLTGDGRVIGVVSEADLLIARDRDGERADALTAGRMMSVPAVTVHPGSPLAEAGRVMARGHLKRLPVVDGEDYLVGVVSRGDLLKVHLADDRDLADRVRFELAAALGPATAVEAGVHAEDGRITLSGTLPDALSVPVLERLVRSVPGVVGVEVRLGAPA